MHYRLNAPRFAAETFDNEVVILDVEGGVYYSLEGAAVWLFQSLAAGAALECVTDMCPAPYASDAREVADRLVAEAILVPTGEPSTEAPPAPADAARPRLTRYDDLQLLLQIDPVHDVDATGWPNPASS